MSSLTIFLLFFNFFPRTLSTSAKPYTLKVPILLPLTGPINPLDGICTNIAELAASDFNNQNQYLTDYNIVFDLIDDQCNPITGVRHLLPFYQNWQPTGDIKMPSRQRFPSNQSIFNQSLDNKSFNVPLLGGPICSGPCTKTSNLPQHFNFLQVSFGNPPEGDSLPTKGIQVN